MKKKMGQCPNRSSKAKKQAKREWTTQEIHKLKEHRRAGSLVLARMLNRTPKAVRNKASEYGISLCKSDPPVANLGTCEACHKEMFLVENTELCIYCFIEAKEKEVDEINRRYLAEYKEQERLRDQRQRKRKQRMLDKADKEDRNDH